MVYFDAFGSVLIWAVSFINFMECIVGAARCGETSELASQIHSYVCEQVHSNWGYENECASPPRRGRIAIVRPP